MIVVTGAAGFIGSCMVSELNRRGREDIVVVDSLKTSEKWMNLRHLRFHDYLDKGQLFDFLSQTTSVEAIVHMGACSATTERDADYLMENNYRYTLKLAQYCLERDIRFIYASSAATYGSGEEGYEDKETELETLRPLNMYGYSKHLFDLRAKRQGWLDKMVGLKFFNVYGPNEYHKGDMTSVIYKAHGQILDSGKVRLFKSHREGYGDGEQSRDFIYVKDVVAIMAELIEKPQINGLFNLGTGQARSFKDLALATFAAMEREANIEFFDMPEHLRGKYQYYTCAAMEKLRKHGIDHELHSLESGVADYVKHHLDQAWAPF